jgi:hypothetical protein
LQDSDCNYVFVDDVPTADHSDKSKYEPVAALCEWKDAECNDGDVNSNDVPLLSLKILDDGVKAMSGRSFGMVQVSKPEAAHSFNLIVDSTTALSLKEDDLSVSEQGSAFCTQITASSDRFGVVVEDSDTVIRKDESAPVTTDTMDARTAFSEIMVANNGEGLRTGALKFSATATLNLNGGCDGYVGGSCEPSLNLFYLRSPGKTAHSLIKNFDGTASAFNKDDSSDQHPFRNFSTCASMADNFAARVKQGVSVSINNTLADDDTALAAFNALFGPEAPRPNPMQWTQSMADADGNWMKHLVPFNGRDFGKSFSDASAEINVDAMPATLYDLKGDICTALSNSSACPVDAGHYGYNAVNHVGAMGTDTCNNKNMGSCNTTGNASHACYGDADCGGASSCIFADDVAVDWYCETKPIAASELTDTIITEKSVRCDSTVGGPDPSKCNPPNAFFTGRCVKATTCKQQTTVACTDGVIGPAKCSHKPFYYGRKWFANAKDEEQYVGAAWADGTSTSYPVAPTHFSYAALEYEFDTTLDKLMKCKNADNTQAVKVTTEGSNTKYEFEQCATTLTPRPRLNYEQDATTISEAQYEAVTSCRSYSIVMNRESGFTTGVTMSQPTLAFIYNVELVDANYTECVADWNWATGQGNGTYSGYPMAKLSSSQATDGTTLTGFGPNNACTESDATAGLVKRLKITVHIEAQDINSDYLVFPSQYPHSNSTCTDGKSECYDKSEVETNLVAQMRTAGGNLDNCYGLMNYDASRTDRVSTFRHEPTIGQSAGSGAMGRLGYTRTTGVMYTAAINTKGEEDAFMKCVASAGDNVPAHSTNFDFGTAEGKKLLTPGQVERQQNIEEYRGNLNVGDPVRVASTRGYALWKCKNRNETDGSLDPTRCNQGSSTFTASLDIARTVTITPAVAESSVLTEVRFFSSPYNENTAQRNEIVPQLNTEDQNYKATVSDKYDVAIMASVKYRYDVCDTAARRCMLGRAHVCTTDADCNGGGENSGWYKNLALAVDKVVFATMKKCCYDPMINVLDVSAAPLNKPRCEAVSTDAYSPLACVAQGLDPDGPYHCEGTEVPKLNELDEAGWYRFLVSERVNRRDGSDKKYASKFGDLKNRKCSLPPQERSPDLPQCPGALADVGLSAGCWGAANRLYFMNDHMVAIDHGTITDVANATYGTCEGVVINKNVTAIPAEHKGICTCKGMNARSRLICPDGQFNNHTTCLDRKVTYDDPTMSPQQRNFLETCTMDLDFAESQNFFSQPEADARSSVHARYTELLQKDGIVNAYGGTFKGKKSFDAVILPASKFPYGMMMYMEITMKLKSIEPTDSGRRLLSLPYAERTTLIERVYGKGAELQSDGSILVKSSGFVGGGAGTDYLAEQLDRGIPVGVMPTLFPSLEVVPDGQLGILTGSEDGGGDDDDDFPEWAMWVLIAGILLIVLHFFINYKILQRVRMLKEENCGRNEVLDYIAFKTFECFKCLSYNSYQCAYVWIMLLGWAVALGCAFLAYWDRAWRGVTLFSVKIGDVEVKLDRAEESATPVKYTQVNMLEPEVVASSVRQRRQALNRDMVPISASGLAFESVDVVHLHHRNGDTSKFQI